MDHTPQTEITETLIKQNEAIDQMIQGAKMVAAGGIEGIQHAALAAPELLLEVINVLTDLTQNQQTTIARLTEQKFEVDDQLDKIYRSLRSQD